MAEEMIFPLLPVSSDPFAAGGQEYPRTVTFADGASAPLFSHGVVSSLHLEEIARTAAAAIAARYAGQRLLVVQVLEGARVFARMLRPHLERLSAAAGIQSEIGSVQIRSYTHGSRATEHRILTPLLDGQDREVKDCRHFDGVVLVDDLIDGGDTMAWLIADYLPRFAATGLGFCSMLDKHRLRDKGVEELLARCAVSRGRQVPNEWLVGYGLDMALPGSRETPSLHLFRQELPGGVYAFNSAIEARLTREYQERPVEVAEQLAAYRS